jgi:capsular polysaccharide biosynthesis protein
MNDTPLPRDHGKAEAVVEVARRAGIPVANGWDSRGVPDLLERARAAVPPIRNQQIAEAEASSIGLQWIPVHHANTRALTPAIFTNGQPDCFGGRSVINAHSPDYAVLSIPNGYVGHFFGCCTALARDGRTAVRDVSSFYSGLRGYYDFDMAAILDEAPFVDGTVVQIADDIRPLNFCHWLIDWLPRLEFLGPIAHRGSTYVATTPLIAEFQRESLRMCGFDDSRIIALDEYSAVRARDLLVPSDLRDIPHPIHKGAPWALSYLRSTVGLESATTAGLDLTQREKIHVSRADASRRRIANDAELSAALARFGYRTIQLSGLPLAEQAAWFAKASHVVGLHGAGLSNLAFVRPGTTVIEIFPRRYGLLSFAVLAASLECRYATYIADRTVPHEVSQFDDSEIDVERFLDACGHLI